MRNLSDGGMSASRKASAAYRHNGILDRRVRVLSVAGDWRFPVDRFLGRINRIERAYIRSLTTARYCSNILS